MDRRDMIYLVHDTLVTSYNVYLTTAAVTVILFFTSILAKTYKAEFLLHYHIYRGQVLAWHNLYPKVSQQSNTYCTLCITVEYLSGKDFKKKTNRGKRHT